MRSHYEHIKDQKKLWLIAVKTSRQQVRTHYFLGT